MEPAGIQEPVRFSVGYNRMDGDRDVFSDIVREYRAHIREVYFAWPGDPSGRAPLDPATAEFVLDDLVRIRSLGVDLNLLFNASCYGERAVSAELQRHVRDVLGRGVERLAVTAVTTLSPLVARVVKEQFSDIDVRASVNLRLGTRQALEYAAPFFDSYTVQRETNRDLNRFTELQTWAEQNGKDLHVLANSGCLNFCSFQTFHDNAVAHEGEIQGRGDAAGMATLCREYYADREHWVNFLCGSWIRPEDIAAHAARVRCGYKLATRMHDNPRLVIHAYASGRHYGNLLDLMEPGFGSSFFPWAIDNSRFPADWFEKTANCRHAGPCATCREVLADVLVRADGWQAERRR